MTTLLLIASGGQAQSNTWSRMTPSVSTDVFYKQWGALVYAPDSNRFLSTLGMHRNSYPARYGELALNLADRQWTNFLPHDSLIGKWALDTGVAFGNGAGFEDAEFKKVEGYLRPTLEGAAHKAFYQYAYNPDDFSIYYYLYNRTFRYNTHTRLWDTLLTNTHPAIMEGGTRPLTWGSMCYDPVHKEMILFGGTGTDAKNGNCGTWTFKPSTREWKKVNAPVEPPPRCYSQMVYSAKEQSMVLFGGDHLDKLFADTWVYDCATATWSERKPPLSPSPRAGHALVYLPKSEAIILIGGYHYTLPNADPSKYLGYSAKDPLEMWRYNLPSNEWKLIKVFTGGPKPNWLFQAAVAADTGDRIVIVSDSANAGNGMYIQHSYFLSCDPTPIDEDGTANLGVPSGTTESRLNAGNPDWFRTGVAAPNPDSLSAFYESLPVNTWFRMTQPRMPYWPRDWGTRVMDPVNDQIVVWAGGHSAYGGSDIPQYSPSTNRWNIGYTPEFMLEYDGANGDDGYPWYFTFNNRPFMSVHTYDIYDFDVNLKKVVAVKAFKYTYTYDATKMDWDSTRILNHPNMAEGTGTFYRTTLTSTPHGVFCSSPKSGTTTVNFFMMDAATSTWKPLPMKSSTSLPTYHADNSGACYDELRDRIIFAIEGPKPARVATVYAFSFKDSSFKRLNPPHGAIANSTHFYREAVYIPVLDKILFEATVPGGNLVWDCAKDDWMVQPLTRDASVSSADDLEGFNTGLLYDKKRGLVWNIGQKCEVFVMRPGEFAGTANETARPAAFPDLQATPNPFSSHLSIAVNMPTAGKLDAKVFDVSGRMVYHLATTQPKAGLTHISWNGFDRHKNRVAPGLYILRIYASGKELHKPVILTQ